MKLDPRVMATREAEIALEALLQKWREQYPLTSLEELSIFTDMVSRHLHLCLEYERRGQYTVKKEDAT